jgi:hypothetical protein
MKRLLLTAGLSCMLGLPPLAFGYPLDGYQDTGIRRVEGFRLMTEGVIKGRKQPPGARLTTEQVDLHLLHQQDMALPATDPEFTMQIQKLLGKHANRYGISVLDLSDKNNPRYAEWRGDYRQNVGSVGKMVGALGFFQALVDAWPDDLQKRETLLRNTIVTADSFSHGDHHKIKIFDLETQKLSRRPVRDGDQGNLWEWLDWMLSVSSNAAAAMVMREAMLLRHFGKNYPVSEDRIHEFFKETPKKELTALFKRTFWEPVTRNGLDISQLRQGSFFTAQGKRNVYGGGNSYGTSRSLMELVLRMEQGKLVDEWSSRNFKRLLYMTENRIRYASSPALKDAAVYFKSGSLYSCDRNNPMPCGKYKGTGKNYMNSVAIIESPAGEYRLHYVVTLISNVLGKNSAVDHQTLATRIHRLIEAAHPTEEAGEAAMSGIPPSATAE